MNPLTPLLLDSPVGEYEQQGYSRVPPLLTDHHLHAITNELDVFLHCRTIHCSHENRSESRRRTDQAAYCDADALSQITGQPYNEKPKLLEDGQPTDVVRNTWTHLGHHIEHRLTARFHLTETHY